MPLLCFVLYFHLAITLFSCFLRFHVAASVLLSVFILFCLFCAICLDFIWLVVVSCHLFLLSEDQTQVSGVVKCKNPPKNVVDEKNMWDGYMKLNKTKCNYCQQVVSG